MNMFSNTIASKVKKVMTERIKHAEAQYKQHQEETAEECRVKQEDARLIKEKKDQEAAEALVQKVLGK